MEPRRPRPRYCAPSSPPGRGGRENKGLRRKCPPGAGSAGGPEEAADGRKPKFVSTSRSQAAPPPHPHWVGRGGAARGVGLSAALPGPAGVRLPDGCVPRGADRAAGLPSTPGQWLTWSPLRDRGVGVGTGGLRNGAVDFNWASKCEPAPSGSAFARRPERTWLCCCSTFSGLSSSS